MHPKIGSVFLVLLAVSVAACSGDGASTAPSDAPTLLSSAVLVDGLSVGGTTMANGTGSSTVFRARVADPQGLPDVARVYMKYEKRDMMGMHGSQGMVALHDDGMGCDEHAGDGDYCHEDHMGDMGCHGSNAGMGEHNYEFYCEDQEGHHSNHQMQTVNVQ